MAGGVAQHCQAEKGEIVMNEREFRSQEDEGEWDEYLDGEDIVEVSEDARVVPYSARSIFEPFHARTARWAIIVAHRRAGKTVATINDLLKRAVTDRKEDGRYAYIAPFFAQAKDVAWHYLKRYARPML